MVAKQQARRLARMGRFKASAATLLVAAALLGPATRAVATGLEARHHSVLTTLSTTRDPQAFARDLNTPMAYGHVPLTRREAVAEEMLARARSLGGEQAAATAEVLCDEADRAGFDPLLILALIDVESGFNHLAISRVGAEGLMQLMPETAEFLAARGRLDWPDNHTFDPKLNVTLGVRYMAELQRMFHGHLDQALTAYNRGPAATRTCLRRHPHLSPAIRATYADRVMAHYRLLHRRYGQLPPA